MTTLPLAALTALLSLGLVAPSQEHALKRVPKAGDAIRHRLKAELEFIGTGTGTMTATSTERTLRLEPDGGYTIQSETRDVAVEVDGNHLKGADQAPMQTTFSPLGDVVMVRGEKIGSLDYRITNLNAFRAPGKQVKAGDTWTRDIAADAKTGMVAAKATFTFEALEKLGDFETAKIKYQYAEAVERDPASAEGIFWIHIADGSIVKSEIRVKNMPLPNAGIKINAKVTAERI